MSEDTLHWGLFSVACALAAGAIATATDTGFFASSLHSAGSLSLAHDMAGVALGAVAVWAMLHATGFVGEASCSSGGDQA